MEKIKIVFLGDIFGKIGRKGVIKLLPTLKKEYRPDFIIANAENLAHGHGITRSSLQEMLAAGINFFTSGNHIFDKPDGEFILAEKDAPIIRPANYIEEMPGQGEKILNIGEKKLLVVNLMGRVFFTENYKNPFKTVEELLKKYKNEDLAGIIVDFHAEATSEKVALGYFLDGQVSAIIGTHTHIQTADEKILNNGSAYISDVGMIGAKESVIGLDKDQVVQNFINEAGMSADIPESGQCIINGIYLEIDSKTKKAIKIKRINKLTEIK
ncbi:TIGR00282 family metallophosphoesterase [Candidatus Falkowbacteria bacterium]|nr:TIGR00282 family metallophosphoesterase [Candidatus Falkowbacteria bacterium]